MSVPNTTTFSMQEVANEIGAGDNLVELFSLANDDGFDPAYEGSKNSLLNFRNYTHDVGFIITQDAPEAGVVMTVWQCKVGAGSQVAAPASQGFAPTDTIIVNGQASSSGGGATITSIRNVSNNSVFLSSTDTVGFLIDVEFSPDLNPGYLGGDIRVTISTFD